MVTLEIAAADGRLFAGVLSAGTLTDLTVDRLERPDRAGTVYLARVDRTFGNRAMLALGTGAAAILEGRQVAGLRPGGAVMVQILRPARAGKAAEATTDIGLAGATLIHRPAGQGIAVSDRLSPSARRDWKERLAGRAGGWILRSAAAGMDPALILAEADRLTAAAAQLAAQSAAATPPQRLVAGPDPAERLLLDHPMAGRIEVADAALARRVRRFAGRAVPWLLERIVETDGSALPDAAASLLDPVVGLPSGGSLTIEQTRALTAIDVDTGRADPLRTNLEAAAAIARHLRLRAIGGIVVVDFVSMERRSDQARVVAALRDAATGDPARLTLPDRLSPLGLAELARERRGPSLAEALA